MGARRPGHRPRLHVPARPLRIIASDALSFQPGQGRPALDASGELDRGHIDSFVPVDWEGRDAWLLTGEWGGLLVATPEIAITLSQ